MNIYVIKNKSNSISILNILHKIIKTHFKKLNIKKVTKKKLNIIKGTHTMNLVKSHKINFKQRKHFNITCTYLE